MEKWPGSSKFRFALAIPHKTHIVLIPNVHTPSLYINKLQNIAACVVVIVHGLVTNLGGQEHFILIMPMIGNLNSDLLITGVTPVLYPADYTCSSAMNLTNIPKMILEYLLVGLAERVKASFRISVHPPPLSQTQTQDYDSDPVIRDLCRTLPRLPPSSLPPGWSCDWESWLQRYEFIVQPRYHSLSYADMTMACIYNLSVPIRLIAYSKESHDHTYVFMSGGEYYFYMPEAEELRKLEGEGLKDDNVLRVALRTSTHVEEDEDGCEKRYYLEMKQRSMAQTAD
jgi:hypothetical protein